MNEYLENANLVTILNTVKKKQHTSKRTIHVKTKQGNGIKLLGSSS